MPFVLTAYAFRGLRHVKPEHAKMLTHLNIAFGLVEGGRVTTDKLTDMDYLPEIRAANPGIQALLSVGGWSAGGFSEAASTPEGRELFSQTAAEAVAKYGLDGIDIDWEYPTIGVAGIGWSPNDKETFTLLLAELRAALDKQAAKEGGRPKLLTIAAGADQYWIDGTNMAEAQRYLDYVQIMTYDMRGGFQVMTGHHTNLYPSPGDLFRASVETSVNNFAAAGVPKNKIVIGAAFYGRKWVDVPNINNGLFQMTKASGGGGGHYELLVKDFINKNGFVRHWDPVACAPWLFNGDTFITYEDPESLAAKCKYLKGEGLAGIMYWEHGCDPSGELLGAIYAGLNA